MSFKKFSSGLGTPTTEKPGDTAKNAPATDQPAAQPDKTPDKVGPESKS